MTKVFTLHQRNKGNRKGRGKKRELESPNLTDKQRLKLDEVSPHKEHSDSIQKVQKAAKVTKSPFLSTDMAQSTDVP